MQRRPLADDFRPHARVVHLVRRSGGVVVGGNVADAIAAGLEGMHLHAGKLGQDVRRVFQLDPVVLDVLPRGEMTEATVITARDMRELAHLQRRQRAIGHGHAQHIGVQLQVEAVLQAQRLEFVFGDLARQAAIDLAAKLLHALIDQALIDFGIIIHGIRFPESGWSVPSRGYVHGTARARGRHPGGRPR